MLYTFSYEKMLVMSLLSDWKFFEDREGTKDNKCWQESGERGMLHTAGYVNSCGHYGKEHGGPSEY